MTTSTATPKRAAGLPTWFWIVVPALALVALVAVFAATNPASIFVSSAPPVEDLALERITIVPEGFVVTVFNNGPTENTIAQVTVDDAFWAFTAEPSATLPRLGRVTVKIPYAWVAGEPHLIKLITPTGTPFEGVVAAATLTPTPGVREIGAYALLGIYVGVIPVVLGMLWFPAMKRLGRRGLGAILALTLGLLVFLLIDTLLEAFELAAEAPSVFQGVSLALFAALLTWLALMAVSARRGPVQTDPAKQRLYVATLIALGIGLHNLGEGLAIGAAFALGEAALGMHNVTEGVGIAAPVTRDQPSWRQFLALALLAGLPAVVGAWIGGFAFSPIMATLFLGIGVGAIWQVIVEVANLLRRDAAKEGAPVVSWLNVGALLAGFAIMYVTAFLVK
jgi:zinc transporter ZupT